MEHQATIPLWQPSLSRPNDWGGFLLAHALFRFYTLQNGHLGTLQRLPTGWADLDVIAFDQIAGLEPFLNVEGGAGISATVKVRSSCSSGEPQ